MAARSKTATKVSSAAYQRAFGRYSELAQQAPVSITSHGRESLVLLSVTEYRRLIDLDRRALRPWQMSVEAIQALLAAEPPAEAAQFDHEYRRPKRRRK
jgi:PHD/YefM family antitoxin component YafN of YafNO toxin-antitoxin module